MLVEALRLLGRRPDFRNLWLGSIVSQMGDWVGWVAIAVAALHHGTGPLDLALVLAAHQLPTGLLAPFAGVLADRWDRRSLLWLTSVVLGLVTLAMAAAAAVAAISVLQLLLVVRSAGVAFVAPAERAALPRLVEKDELLVATSFDAATWSVMLGLGMTLGGVLTLLDAHVALVLDAITFAVAAACFARLPSIEPEASAEPRRANLVHELREALAFVWTHPSIRRATFAKAPVDLATGAAWVSLALQVDALAGPALGGLGLGAMHAVRAVGTGIGPIAISRAISWGVDRRRMWRLAFVFACVGAALVGYAPIPALLVIAVLVWGLGAGGNWVVSTEQIQTLTPDAIMARTHALDQITAMLGMGLGALAFSLPVEFGGSIGLSGLVLTLFALAAGWCLDRHVVDTTPERP